MSFRNAVRQATLKATRSTRLVAAVDRLSTKSWLHPLNDVAAIDDLLAQFNPLWSLNEVRARVEHIHDETADTRTFVLRPNRHWSGFSAGQHAVVTVEIDGVRQSRAYSLSSSPREARLISITVKRRTGGRVSNALHEQIAVGDTLGLSAAGGQFVLPVQLPEKILLLGAGSGVTPLMSMLLELEARAYEGDVIFVHGSRFAADAIFGKTLRALACRFPALRWMEHYSEAAGRLDASKLEALVPDYAERTTFLCGPQAVMDWVQDHWNAQGLNDRLSFEHFGAPVSKARAAGEPQAVTCTKSAGFSAPGAASLLVEAAAAGLKPKYGCRSGICASCTCRKVSGRVENLLTGEISDHPDELIRICVSAARSDLQLDL